MSSNAMNPSDTVSDPTDFAEMMGNSGIADIGRSAAKKTSWDPRVGLDVMGGFCYHDGGRSKAGFKGAARDCAVRAIAIAGLLDYRHVYDRLFDISREIDKGHSPRNGVSRKVIDAHVVGELGWTWKPTMKIGSGTTVHLRADELPAGRLVVRLSKHFAAVADGMVYDTYDPRRGGNRAVYGYWIPQEGLGGSGSQGRQENAETAPRLICT